MRVRIEFDVDNAAFEDNRYSEVRFVLKQAAGRLAHLIFDDQERLGRDTLRDSNGNTIGTVTIER